VDWLHVTLQLEDLRGARHCRTVRNDRDGESGTKCGRRNCGKKFAIVHCDRQQGNLGRNVFNGPGFVNTDMSVFKTFRLKWITAEGATLQMRFEAFNAFNRVSDLPRSEFTSPA
jgi:hypothetical protein